MKQERIWRCFFYCLGIFILAFGLTLNTKTGLGATAIIAVSFSISEIWKLDFGNTTLAMYLVFIFMQLILYVRKYGRAEKGILIKVLLQFPMSIIFTRFLNIFSQAIPVFSIEYAGTFWGSMGGRLFFLAVALLCTGVGSALSIPMNLVPSAGDGIVKAISDCFSLSRGLSKNMTDFSCVAVAAVLGFLCRGKLVGVGIGTFAAMIVVGRVISVFDFLFQDRVLALAGMSQEKKKDRSKEE